MFISGQQSLVRWCDCTHDSTTACLFSTIYIGCVHLTALPISQPVNVDSNSTSSSLEIFPYLPGDSFIVQVPSLSISPQWALPQKFNTSRTRTQFQQSPLEPRWWWTCKLMSTKPWSPVTWCSYHCLEWTSQWHYFGSKFRHVQAEHCQHTSCLPLLNTVIGILFYSSLY